MDPQSDNATIAFDGDRRIASGGLREIVSAAKEVLERRKDASILVFDGGTGLPIDIDFRGAIDDVLARLNIWRALLGGPDQVRRFVERG